MAKPEQVNDPALRERIQKAHDLMRGGKPSDAVKECAAAYIELLQKKPEIVQQGFANVRPALMWPRLGANLSLRSLAEGKPEIEFERERFTLSEAITYYEFTLESAVKNNA